LRATFDFGNFVEVNVRPFDQAYPLLKDFIEHVHVKDAQRLPGGTCRVAPAGKGDGQVSAVLTDLAAQPRNIFLSVEPRGATAGPLGGEPDPRSCVQAVLALKKLLEQIGSPKPGITQSAP
jgi:sugar phosphate isomerase/epimerase